MNECKLKRWILRNIISDNLYLAPEALGRQLKGEVSGHPRHKDGACISTSAIQKVEGRRVTTHNTIYELDGPPHPDYLEWMTEHGYSYDEENPIKIKG